MNNKKILAAVLIYLTFSAFSNPGIKTVNLKFPKDTIQSSEDRHLKNIKQLTFGGENAECYFSPDGSKFCFQSTRGDSGCDQIYSMNTDGSGQKLISTGKGRTTCSYYYPDNKTILYSS
ncbi:MAG: hypothetical protein M3P82_00845, partial [Bacteroidota bacterium]|nr:hypothetical protein [Bacteroidota bacterium]